MHDWSESGVGGAGLVSALVTGGVEWRSVRTLSLASICLVVTMISNRRSGDVCLGGGVQNWPMPLVSHGGDNPCCWSVVAIRANLGRWSALNSFPSVKTRSLNASLLNIPRQWATQVENIQHAHLFPGFDLPTGSHKTIYHPTQIRCFVHECALH